MYFSSAPDRILRAPPILIDSSSPDATSLATVRGDTARNAAVSLIVSSCVGCGMNDRLPYRSGWYPKLGVECRRTIISRNDVSRMHRPLCLFDPAKVITGRDCGTWAARGAFSGVGEKLGCFWWQRPMPKPGVCNREINGFLLGLSVGPHRAVVMRESVLLTALLLKVCSLGREPLQWIRIPLVCKGLVWRARRDSNP
jgi:hypothetical protein